MSSHLFHVECHKLPGQHIREYHNATRDGDATLEVAIKHYRPLKPIADRPLVTIIGTHANGIPKARR